MCKYLDEHHEGAGEEGHVDQGAEGDQPSQRRALGQERLSGVFFGGPWYVRASSGYSVPVALYYIKIYT